MPVIEVNYKDFQELLGREVSKSELMDRLPMMGTGWEGESEEGFNLEVFPNRPDLLSIEGLAKAYASWTGEKTGLRLYNVMKTNYEVRIDEKTKNVRPWFVTAVVKNVDFDDSLIRSIIQMQEKLHMTHGRKRRKVAIGLHSLEPIEFPVFYTTKSPEFKFRPLGERFEKDLTWMLTEMKTGKEYAWILEGFNEYPMILDKKGMVLSMPPIINGEYTRIDESTRELFIDVTGTDLKAITEVLNVICTTFADRGAEIYEVHNHYPDGTVLTTPYLDPWVMELDNEYVNLTLGSNFSPEETAYELMKMGHGTEIEKNIIKVSIPSYRADVMHPIDLVEDVAIAYDYDNFDPVIPPISSDAGEAPLEIFSRGLRNFLVGFGFLEVVTFMMSNRDKLFYRMNLPEEPICETENPKMDAYNSLRNRLLPSIIEILSLNKHHPYPQNLYEVDDIVIIDPSTETGARTKRRLAIVLCHSKANFSEIKSIMNGILDNLELKVDIEAEGWQCFLEGRKFTAYINDQPICWAGEIMPQVLEKWEIDMPIAALEMDVDLLFELFSQNK
jgi:phenylalanyl-tRNA synthetase beta chain